MRKNYLKGILFVFLISAISATSVHSSAITVIKGHYTVKNAKWVKLYSTHDGGKMHIASVRLSDDGGFAFMINELQKGLYYLSDQSEKIFLRFYAEPGHTIEVEVKSNKYELIRPSRENSRLYDWQKDIYEFYFFMLEVGRISDNPKNYLPMLTKLKRKLANEEWNTPLPNPFFQMIFKAAQRTDIGILELQAGQVLSKFPNYDSGYGGMAPDLFSDTTILFTGEGVELMARHVRKYFSLTKGTLLPFSGSSLFGNDRLKNVFLRHTVDSYVDLRLLADSLSACAMCRDLMHQDAFRLAVYNKFLSIRKLAKGEPGYPFLYKDANGRMTAMNDFKGKWVLVDVWATWCVPCREELPYLAKLKEDLRGYNIEIIGISADQSSYEMRWKKFVDDNQLDGVQLFSGSWEDFTDYYDIPSIPRFLIFDPDGNLVTTRAPRPSSPELKEMLLVLMSKDNN